MWQTSNGSVSAPTMGSIATPSFIRWPHRMPGSQYGARLIDSAPPATATSQSPSMTDCEADTIRFRAGSADRLAHHLRGHVTGRHGGQAPAVLADRGPDRRQDEHLFHDSP